MHPWRSRWSSWTGRSRFARNLWRVARANVLAQALPLLAAPLLTRLYAPSDFGALAIFASLLGLSQAVCTLRLEWSVPQAGSAPQAAALLVLGAVVLAGFTALGSLAWAMHDAWWPANGLSLGAVGWLLPLALLGLGAQQLLSAWHVRSAELDALGRAKVTQSLAGVAVSLAASAAGLWGLAAGLVAGAWVGLGTLWRRAAGLRDALREVGRAGCADAWRRFRGEALWSTLASVANTASFAIVPLLLARHFGAIELGYYALVQRLALAPLGLIGAAVSQSFWAEAARLVREDLPALERLYRRSSWRLALLSLPLAGLALAGPWFVGPLFGSQQWQAAGAVLAASVPLVVGQVIASSLSHLIIHGKQHWQALWDVARIVLLALAIEGLGRAGAGFVSTVAAVSAVMGAMYGVLVWLNLRALAAARKG